MIQVFTVEILLSIYFKEDEPVKKKKNKNSKIEYINNNYLDSDKSDEIAELIIYFIYEIEENPTAVDYKEFVFNYNKLQEAIENSYDEVFRQFQLNTYEDEEDIEWMMHFFESTTAEEAYNNI